MNAPVLTGVHHVTYPVRDLEASVTWFERCLGAERIARLDHHDADGQLFAAIVRLPGHGPLVQLRIAPGLAAAATGYDPVTFAVADRAELDRWAAHLDAREVAHSEVTSRRIGESVDFASPDGLVLRLYTEPVGSLDSIQFTE